MVPLILTVDPGESISVGLLFTGMLFPLVWWIVFGLDFVTHEQYALEE